jgi:hypothetical protein
VDGRKNALIVTDGTETIGKMAEAISAALKDFSVITLAAKDFAGTNILPADICFFGSETPNPSSFTYLNTLLKHINLAGRPCGIFSNSVAAEDYLRGLVHDSELALYPVALMDGKGDVKKWTKSIVDQLKKR